MKTHAFLHILLSPAILKDTKGIIDSHDPFVPKNLMIKLPCLSNELTHSDSSFRDWPEIIQAGPVQYTLGPDAGNADRKIGILWRVLKPYHEPCFKASIPSCSWNHMHRVEIGCGQGHKAGLTGRGPCNDMHPKRTGTEKGQVPSAPSPSTGHRAPPNMDTGRAEHLC